MDFNSTVEQEIKKFDLDCRSLWRAYEMVELKHTDMIEHADYKLMMESGTYDDAIWLYEEANAETNQSKKGIFQRIGDAIRRLIQKIKRFFKGEDTQQAINSVDPNKKYSGQSAPGIGSEQDIANHHNKITEIIGSIKTLVTGKIDEIPDNVKNLGKNIFGSAVGVGTVVVGGSIIQSALKYAQGDVNALNDTYDWLQAQIDKIPDNDGDRINWGKSILERFQELVTKETTWSNNLLGFIASKTEGAMAKANSKAADSIRKSKEYKDLLDKQADGTITDKEKERLDELEKKAAEKDVKADEHTSKKEKAENLKNIGNLESDLNKLNTDIKKTNNMLQKGKLSKDDANKEKDNYDKKLSSLNKLYEDNKDDKRVSQANKDAIVEALKKVRDTLDEFKKAIDNSSASSNTKDSNNNNNNSGSSNNDNDTNTDEETNDDETEENDNNDESEENSSNNSNNDSNNKNQSKKSIKGVTPKEYTGSDSDNVTAWRLKNGKLRNSKSAGRSIDVKGAKKLKNAVYGSGPKGDAWYYEDTEDDWFDIDIDTPAVFESYSGALDDELLSILNEL